VSIQQLVVFAVLGLGYGALLAGLSIGILVTYRSSHVINIAVGATAAYSAYMYSSLRSTGTLFLPPSIQLTSRHQPLGMWPSLTISLVFAAVLGLVQYLLVYRPLANANALVKIVASAGVLLAVQSVIVLHFGANSFPAAAVLPQGGLRLFGIAVPLDRLALAGLVIVAAAGLWVLYKFSRFGIATRAAADNKKGAVLLGISSGRLEALNWVIAGGLSGLFGIIAAPTTQLQPASFTLLAVPVLIAALLAGFSTFGAAVAASFGLGILTSMITLFQGQSWFPQVEGAPVPGLTELVLFLILAVVLVFRGRSLPDRLTPLLSGMPRARRSGRPGRTVVVITVLVLVGLVGLPYDWRQAMVNSMIGAILCLSVVVATGYAGQISLAQMSIAGATGYVMALVGGSAGLPFPIPLVAGAAAAVIVSLILSVPARRVRGMQLAVLTLAGAVAVQQFWFNNPLWGSSLHPADVPPIRVFGVTISPNQSFWGSGAPSQGFGLVALAALLICVVIAMGVRRSRLGARMLAVRTSEAAAAATGVNVGAIKSSAFAIAGLIAGIAGAMYAYNFTAVSSERFDPLTSVAFFAIAVLGGLGTVEGALIGGLMVSQGLLALLITKVFGISPAYQPLFAGLAVIAAIVGSPNGVASNIADGFAALRRRRLVAPHSARDVVARGES
jgi:branched-chain amino acid transport system permease protein